MSQKRGNVTEEGPCHKRGHVTTHCPSQLVFLCTVAMYVYLKFLMFMCVPFRYVWCVCWYQRTQHRYTGEVKCVCVCVCGKEASESVKVSVSLVWQGLSLSQSCLAGLVDRSGSITRCI
jgi:hypothetical protein